MQVLILEDDNTLRELLVDAVESLDHVVKPADSATMALHLGREYDFELVISDIRMAGPTDGLGVLQALKQRQPKMACIVITGYADKTAPLRALQIRVDDYLYKPFEVEDLIAAIDRVTQSQSQRTWYRQLLHRLLGQAASDQDLAELQAIRENCLKDFFVAVRSQHLYAETALNIWDTWEELEADYLKIANIRVVAAEVARRLIDRFQLWQARLAKEAATQAFVAAGTRSEEKVDRATFRRFIERIKQARLSAENLGLAVALRRIPPEQRRRNPELERYFQRMWS
ncbi:MAG: response regulator [Candidatus Eremiobacteraeota bacterium]|nr:response regulator [Candidatus Eremiobacteraeota bacterium]MCW5868768.1 response regulator [Candidatus Eremiobacteraeota bacterium]